MPFSYLTRVANRGRWPTISHLWPLVVSAYKAFAFSFRFESPSVTPTASKFGYCLSLPSFSLVAFCSSNGQKTYISTISSSKQRGPKKQKHCKWPRPGEEVVVLSLFRDFWHCFFSTLHQMYYQLVQTVILLLTKEHITQKDSERTPLIASTTQEGRTQRGTIARILKT